MGVYDYVDKMFFIAVGLVIVGVLLACVAVYLSAYVECAKQNDGAGLFILVALPFIGLLGTLALMPMANTFQQTFEPYRVDGLYWFIVLLCIIAVGILALALPQMTKTAVTTRPRSVPSIITIAMQWFFLGAAIALFVS